MATFLVLFRIWDFLQGFHTEAHSSIATLVVYVFTNNSANLAFRLIFKLHLKLKLPGDYSNQLNQAAD
jgi:hypothetical protein